MRSPMSCLEKRDAIFAIGQLARDLSLAHVDATRMPGACRCDPSLSQVETFFHALAAHSPRRSVPFSPATVEACDDTRADHGSLFSEYNPDALSVSLAAMY